MYSLNKKVGEFMNNINDIKRAIQRGAFTHDELASLIVFTRSTMTQQAKASINVLSLIHI